MKDNILIKIGRNILFAASIISIAVIGVLNNTWIYGVVVEKYNILQYTHLSYDSLMENYKILIDYLGNPFTKELIFKDFPMSTYGKIHFEEVKNIFMSLNFIIILFVIVLIGIILLNKSKNRGEIILKGLNGGCNLIMGVTAVIVVAVIVDFSKTFEVFHKIFFRNDYWIFDSVTDPIINVLPEEFFFIELIIILAILITVIISVKLIRRKKNKA